MALYKGNQKYTISTNFSNDTNVVPLTATKDGVFTAPSGTTGYSPVTVNNTMPFSNMGNHCDKDGIWHKPAEWDDIESIDLTDKHEVYFLCACHRTAHDWFRIRFYGGGTLKWSYGHVSNGTYTIHTNSTETTVSSGAYIALYLGNIADDYVVVRITATSYISSCSFQAWSATSDLNCAMPAMYQSVLMRYGRMIRGSTLAASATYCMESDNIIDFAKYYQGSTTAITVSSAYNGAFNLQRWRCTGWDLSQNKITTFASMFNNCWCLTDTPDKIDCKGWVTSNTTTTASMFANCYSLRCSISAENWNLSNITTMASTFTNCKGVKYIIGTETWTSAPKCTNVSNLFNNCQIIRGTIDVSTCAFGGGTANLTTVANMFNGCQSLTKINISNMNLSKCTTITYFLQSTQALKELVMNNVTGITSTCTNTSYLAGYTGLEELVINGWNFSGCTTAFLTYLSYYAMGLKKLSFTNCTAPTGVEINDTVSCCYNRYAYNLEYLDMSFVDMSVFTNTKTHAEGFRDLYNLIDFYPPKNISKSFTLTNDYNLSHDSLVRVITNLKTLATGTTATLTIGSYNIAKLSAAEKAVATGKGWTLA